MGRATSLNRNQKPFILASLISSQAYNLFSVNTGDVEISQNKQRNIKIFFKQLYKTFTKSFNFLKND